MATRKGGKPEGVPAKSWADRKGRFKNVQLYRTTADKLKVLAGGAGSIADYVETALGKTIASLYRAYLDSLDEQPQPGRKNQAG